MSQQSPGAVSPPGEGGAGRRIHDFFHASAHPGELAVVRIAVFGALFVLGFGHPNDVRWFAALPDALFVPPPGWEGLFPSLPRGSGFAATLRLVFLAACASAMAGFGTRLAGLVALLTSLYVLGLPQSLGKLNHFHHLWWMAAVLTVSPAADALSVDRWRSGEPAPGASVAYGMPIRFVWVLIGIVYFFPGVWKVAVCGLDWALSDNLRGLMYQKWVELEGFLPAIRVDLYPWLYRSLALVTLVFEIGFLPALFFPRLRPWFVVTAFLFHQGTWFSMRIHFLELVVCYVAFVPWAALRDRFFGPPDVQPGDSPLAADLDRRLRPIRWTGGVLVATLLAFGTLGIDSWPFAVYPRFDYFAPEVVSRLRVEVVRPDGTAEPFDDRDLARKLHSSRWAHLQNRLLREPPGSPLWLDFHRLLLAELGEDAPPPAEVRYWGERLSTAPETWADNPIARRPLLRIGSRPREGG